MRREVLRQRSLLLAIFATVFITSCLTYAREEKEKRPGTKEEKAAKVIVQKKEAARTSYAPVTITESFEDMMARMKAAKPEVMKQHIDLLNERYDLSDNPAKDVTMSRGKSIQQGVRVKLPKGVTWEALAAMTPEDILAKNPFPKRPFATSPPKSC